MDLGKPGWTKSRHLHNYRVPVSKKAGRKKRGNNRRAAGQKIQEIPIKKKHQQEREEILREKGA